MTLALGVPEDVTHFLNDSVTQGAVLDKTGEEVLLPTGPSEDEMLFEETCGFFVVPFEDLSLRWEGIAEEVGPLEGPDAEPGCPAFCEEAGS